MSGAVGASFRGFVIGKGVATVGAMRWPHHAVESVRPSRFRPPFCPWPDCIGHRGPTRFHGHGSYRRSSDPRPVPRYRCLACGQTCSRQTFSFTYYLRRRDLPAEVAAALQAGSGHRQIARSRRCTKTTVTRLAERLGRHAMLLHGRLLSEVAPLRETIVHDHFETFIGSQDRALGLGTAVGARSGFVYDVDPAPHRGGGRRPDGPREASTPGPAHRSYIHSISRTLDRLADLASGGASVTLVTDGRRDYGRALDVHPRKRRFVLESHPNPTPEQRRANAPEARVRDAAMAPVDQLHQLIRHTCADHKRETIAFGRRIESAVSRALLTAVWRNLVKGRSERRPDRRTPAMLLGITDRPWGWQQVLAQRLFPSREPIDAASLTIYRREWTSGAPPFRRAHAV